MPRTHLGPWIAATLLLAACADDPATPPSADAARSAPRWDVAPHADKQIYFGDLHVHTNFSSDAFVFQLLNGVNNDPSAACDYARICSQLDFYGQTDHAEFLFFDQWDRTVEAVKQCNDASWAAATPGDEPPMVVFQGFEWTSSIQEDAAWGHKNVHFRNDAVPRQPIASLHWTDVEFSADGWDILADNTIPYIVQETDVERVSRYLDFMTEGILLPKCPHVAHGDPSSCKMVANQPAQLWDALNYFYGQPEYQEAGYDVLAIPHGTAWGMTKLGAEWPQQLTPEQHDPNIQTIAEVYSGHGNSEEFRDFTTAGTNFIGCTEQAKRLTEQKCLDAGKAAVACTAEVDAVSHPTDIAYPVASAEWGLCNQCPDCFQAAETYQPQGSVQAGLAMSGFDAAGRVQTRFQWGFIGSTDEHMGQPGNVFEAKRFTDIPRPLGTTDLDATVFLKGRQRTESERVASFLNPGGLVAVHAGARTREHLWDGLRRREVYATSGPRMALWFDGRLDGARVPMGGALTGTTAPEFAVEAWGGPVEAPGCNAATRDRYGNATIDGLCMGTCYSPTGERHGIDRLEIVKIRPQEHPDEDLLELIEDPWLVIPNEDRDAAGRPAPTMTASFRDPDYAAEGREAIYYVRAIQAASLGVNGQPMFNAAGDIETCTGDPSDDCLTELDERAWSSPIYVRPR